MGFWDKLKGLFSKKKEEQIERDMMLEETKRAIGMEPILDEKTGKEEIEIPENRTPISVAELVPENKEEGEKEETAQEKVEKIEEEDKLKQLEITLGEKIERNRIVLEEMKQHILQSLTRIEEGIEEIKRRLLNAGRAFIE